MRGLQVGVALVLRVPLPVVGQRDHLVRGLVRGGCRRCPGRSRTGPGRTRRGSRRGAPRRAGRRAWPARGTPRTSRPAGWRRTPRRSGGWPGSASCGRRGAGAARPAGGAAAVEAVVVPGRGLQAGHVHLDRVVAAGAGDERAAAHDVAEPLVGGHLPPDPDLRAPARAGRAARGRGDPGPDQHGARLAGRRTRRRAGTRRSRRPRRRRGRWTRRARPVRPRRRRRHRWRGPYAGRRGSLRSSRHVQRRWRRSATAPAV